MKEINESFSNLLDFDNSCLLNHKETASIRKNDCINIFNLLNYDIKKEAIKIIENNEISDIIKDKITEDEKLLLLNKSFKNDYTSCICILNILTLINFEDFIKNTFN